MLSGGGQAQSQALLAGISGTQPAMGGGEGSPSGERLTPGMNALRTPPGNLGPAGKPLPQNAERVALGVNTAAMAAGPKPWEREWITAGMDRNPRLETVFGEPGSSELEKLFAGMKSLESAMKGGALPAEGVAPSAEKPGNVSRRSSLALSGTGSREAAGSAGAESAQIAPETGIPSELLSMLALAGGSIESLEGSDSEGGEPAGSTLKKTSAQGAASLDSLRGTLGGDDFLSARGSLVRGASDSRTSELQAGAASGRGESRPTIGARPRPTLVEPQFRPELSAGMLPGNQTGMNATLGAAMKPQTLELKGHVTTGAMARSRLSSESLMGVTSSIRTLAGDGVRPGGGEMRIRLNPDHLGELSVKVSTRGREVGLQIRASNEEAKRVLEESLSHLRENLASNSLNLARVEVVLDRGGAEGGGMNSQQQQGQFPQYSQQQSQNPFFGTEGGQMGSFGQDSRRSSREESDEIAGLSRPRLGALGPVMNLRSGDRAAGAGRVDVRV
jgi:hypothetical protein